MTDADLVRQALAGTTSAYDALVRRWAARILAVCHARVGRAAAAEDLAQETLLRGLQSLPTLQEPEKFGPWLSGIAVRVCLDWLRKRQRDPESLEAATRVDHPNGHCDVSCELEHAEDLSRLLAEVHRLPEAIREVLMLYYSEDCTYGELAGRLGVSAATINARLTQGRQMLRERMGVEAAHGKNT